LAGISVAVEVYRQPSDPAVVATAGLVSEVRLLWRIRHRITAQLESAPLGERSGLRRIDLLLRKKSTPIVSS
jgi:hypothetical protein